MGCDIHVHVEVKHKDLGWLHYNHPCYDRSYALFYRLVGVRPSDEYEFEPISQPRGLPSDITEMTRLDYRWGKANWHSMSWLSQAELVQLEEWYMEQPQWRADLHGINSRFGYVFDNSFDFRPEDCGKSYPEWLWDIRVVFWFDN